MKNILFTLFVLGVIAVLIVLFMNREESEEMIACAADAMLCPDGTWVGRTGPDCEFDCPPAPAVPPEVQADIDSKADLITLTSPVPYAAVLSPFTVTGEARGTWYFEADFPVVLTDADGTVIAEVPATAEGEWQTKEFVPFTATIEFESQYAEGDSDTLKNGFLILRKDNPFGLPEYDDALEIPVRFAR
jgi:hypothetical protein